MDISEKIMERISNLFTVIFLLIVCGARYSSAYDTQTHRDLLTLESINMFDRNEYGELFALRQYIADGTYDEDSTPDIFIVRNHFYRPTDGAKLSLLGIPFINLSAQDYLTQEDFFQKAIDLYHQGQKTEAYYLFGRTAHLAVQDMYAIQHVFVDNHLNKTIGPVHFDLVPDGYETWVEQNRPLIASSAHRNVSTITATVGRAEISLHESANYTYRTVRIKGPLQADPDVPVFGELATMFPQSSNNKIRLRYICTGINCIPEPVWNIPGAGDCHGFSGYYANPDVRDDWWKVPNFSGEEGDYYYIRNLAKAFPISYKDGSPANGKSLAELFALDKGRLIAQSQNATAALIKQFANLVDPLRPTINIRDANGPLENGGVTYKDTIFIDAADSINTNFPIPSGIYKMVVNGPVSSTHPYTASPAPIVVFETIPNLTVGEYSITVYDGLGNKAEFPFEVQVDPCLEDQDSDECQEACNNDYTSCEQACRINPGSRVCKGYCFANPTAPVCEDNCRNNSQLPYCDPACEYQQSSQACKERCRSVKGASTPLCQRLCRLDRSYCPDGGSGGAPTTTPTDGPGGTQGCNPPLLFYFKFCGGEGACYNIINGRDGCLEVPGESCTIIPYIARNIGPNTFSMVVTDPNTGLSHVDRHTVFVHGCAPDPTFLGGTPFSFVLPEPPTPLTEAFSPGVPGSPNQTYQASYTVFGKQAAILILVRDSEGNQVRMIKDGVVEPSGVQTFQWDGKRDNNSSAPEGLYTITVAQQSVEDPSQLNAYSHYVAIQNSKPTATFGEIAISSQNLNVLSFKGNVADPYLKSYQLGRSTSPTGPFTLTALSSKAPVNGLLSNASRDIFPNGVNYVQLIATNLAGLETSVIKSFTVNRNPSGLTGVSVQILNSSQTVLNPGGDNPPADNPVIFIDDTIPSQSTFNWNWVNSPLYSGSAAHTDTYSDAQPGTRLHYFIHASPGRPIGIGENIIQYVNLGAGPMPQQIMLGFYTDQGDGEHRVYWGSDLIQTGGVPGTPSLLRMGDMPSNQGWVRLKIPAALLNLEGKTIKGMVFGAYGGRAVWDKTTTSGNNLDIQKENALVLSPPSGFNRVTTSLSYILERSANIRLDVYDYKNNALVKNITNGFLSSGTYTATWDQTDELNAPAADGDYYYKFTSTDGPIDSEAIVLAGTSTAAGSFALTTLDANQNTYELNLERQEITKTSREGFALTTLTLSSLFGATGIALNASGDLLVQTSSGVASFDVGRADFSAKTLSANIRIPWDGALVRATVPIIGGASGRNFASYSVDIGPTWNPSTFTLLNQGYSQVVDNFIFPEGFATVYGNLASWETGLVSGEEYPSQDIFHPAEDSGYRGRWTIRLTSKDKEGKLAVSERKVIVGRVINNATGGVIVSDDTRARVIVPPLALQLDWSVFGLVVATTTPPAYQPKEPKGLTRVGPMYEFLPGGYAFKQPVTFQIALPTTTVSGVGMYAYNPDTGLWNKLSGRASVVIDSTSGVTSAVFSDPTMTKVPNFNGFYALYADTSAPAVPVLNPLPATTTRRDLLVSGIAEPSSLVNLYIGSGISTGSFQASFFTNAQGIFSGRVLFSGPGTYNITAANVDTSGNVGALSPPVVIQVTNTLPATITSLNFRDVNFSTGAISTLQKNAMVYVELQASDNDPTQQDAVYINLSSSQSDPMGLAIPLTQIDNTSNRYQGIAYLGSFTNSIYNILAATRPGEIVKAMLENNTSMSTSLPLSDFTIPSAPQIFSPTHPSAFQDTFEANLGDWVTFNTGSGADVMLSSAPVYSGQQAVKLVQSGELGDFSALISKRSFNARTSPIVSFDYFFPTAGSAPRFSLYFRRNGVMHQVEATETDEESKKLPPTFVPIGSIMKRFAGYTYGCNAQFCLTIVPGLGEWRHMEFNVLAMLKNQYPTESDFVVDRIFLGDFNQQQFYGMVAGNAPIGQSASFDNFMVRSAGSSNSNPLFTWTPPAGNVSGYSYVLDQSSDTIPPALSQGTQTSATFSSVAAGYWFFHLRAQNAQGVWGPTNHYAFRIDTAAPIISHPSPEPMLPLLRTPQTKAEVRLTDESGIDLDSLRFTVNGTEYSYVSGGVSYEVVSGSLTIALTSLKPAPVLHDGDIVTLSITNLNDLAGNAIPQAFTWSWQADFSSQIGGGFGPVTFNGGKDAAWAPDSKSLAFASDRLGNEDVFVVTSQEGSVLFESSETVRQLTSSSTNENQPTWSPDGSKLAYVSDAGGNSRIWMMNSDGSGTPLQLTTGPGNDTHPSWSSSGSQIYFSRSTTGVGHLWVLTIDTHTWQKASERQVTQGDVGFNLDSDVSTDGESIVYHRSLYVDNIYSVSPAGVSPIALTNSGSDITPTVSPDGKQIAFATKRDGKVHELWMMDSNGANPKPLLDNLDTWPEIQPAWSPDGGRIAFTTTRSGASNIWLLSILQVDNLTATPANFSPAGTSPTAKKTLTISYQLSAANAIVSIDILNDGGFVIANILQKVTQTGGLHTVTWDGRDATNAVTKDGKYTARLTVTGPAALDPIIRQTSFIVDSTVPALKLLASIGDVASGFFNPSTSLSIEATDISSIQEINLAIDTTTQFNLYTGAFSLTPGTHTLVYRALDAAGNRNGFITATVYVDNQVPVSSISYVGASYANQNGTVFISSVTSFLISAVDDSTFSVVSGIEFVRAKRDEVGYQGIRLARLLDIPAIGQSEGVHSLVFNVADRGGNVETEHVVPIFVDVTNPVVSVETTPALFFNGNRYYAPTSAVFTLSVFDPISSGESSGISQTTISLDQAPFIPYTAGFSFPTEGPHSFRFYATDNVANKSDLQAFRVTIDNNPPTAVLDIAGPHYTAGTPLLGTTNYATTQTQYTLSLATGALAADSLEMNVDNTGFTSSPSPRSLSSEGLHSISFRAVRSGVPETADTYEVVVDTTPPITALVLGFGGAGEYLTPDTVVTLASSDTASGVSTLKYLLNGSTYTYTKPFTFSAQHGLTGGTHSFQWYGTDHLGNTEGLHSALLILDNTAPTLTLEYVGGHQYSDSFYQYASGDTSFRLVANDNGSDGTSIFVDSGTGVGFRAHVETFSYVTSGSHLIQAYAVDAVGNSSPSKIFEVLIDTAGPPISSSPTIPTVLVGSATHARLATGFAIKTDLDSISGIKAVTILADNISSGSPAKFLTEGQHTLEAFATDNVGNVSNPRVLLNIISDETPPQSSLLISGNNLVIGATTYISEQTVLQISATDYFAGHFEPGSGVKESRYSLDGETQQVASGTFTINTAGYHTLRFYSVDALGNAEAVQTRAIAVSVEPSTMPYATLGLSGFTVQSGTISYAPPTNGYYLASVPSSAAIQLSIDEGAFLIYDGSTITFATQGHHSLSYFAEGGELQRFDVTVDTASPITSLMVGTTAYFAGDTITVSTGIPVIVVSTDVHSGVSATYLQVDGNSAQALQTNVISTLSTGTHTLALWSHDRVGNIESPRSFTLVVGSPTQPMDTTPPVTQITFSSAVFITNNIILMDESVSIGFVATDTGTFPSGVAFTRYALDSSSFTLYNSTFTLAVGSYTLAFQSQDIAGNLEALKSYFVFVTSSTPAPVDTVSPETQILFSSTPYVSAGGETFISSSTKISFAAVDSGNPISGVALTEYRVDSSTNGFQLFAASITLREGLLSLEYRSRDVAGNIENTKVTSLRIDASAPATTLQADSIPVSTFTALSLDALDSVVQGVASGVRQTYLSIDAAPYQVYSSSFVLTSSGTHTLSWYSIDQVGNMEVIRSSTVVVRIDPVTVDTVPPVTQMLFAPPAYVNASSQTFITTSTLVSLLASDASTIAFTRYRIDPSSAGAEYTTYTAPFLLKEGVHTIDFFSRDVKENQEIVNRLTIRVDGTAPQVTLQLSVPNKKTPNVIYVSAQTRLSLSGVELSSAGVASGFNRTSYAINENPWIVYAGSFSLVNDGTYTLRWSGDDNAGNKSLMSSATLVADSLPPVTNLLFTGPNVVELGRTLISTSTEINLIAQDSGSGVAGTMYRVLARDDNPFQPYISSFTINQGRHIVAFYSVDQAGRKEINQRETVFVDATPPISQFVVGNPRVALPDGSTLISEQTPLRINANDPLVSGVKSFTLTTWISIDKETPFKTVNPFTLNNVIEGTHAIQWFSRDAIENTEALQNTTLVLDRNPPVANLLSPAQNAQGIDRVFAKGNIHVVGTIQDVRLKNWTLSYAVGLHAVSGFQTICSSTVIVSSATLCVWNANALSGDYTLRLIANDLLNRQTTVTAPVFIGTPVVLQIINGLSNVQSIQFDEAGRLKITGASGVQGAPAMQVDLLSGRSDAGWQAVGAPEQVKIRNVTSSEAGYVYRIDTANEMVRKTDAWKQEVLRIGKEAGVRKPSAVALNAASQLAVSEPSRNRILILGVPGIHSEPRVHNINGWNTQGGAAGAPSVDFVFGEVFVFPNPAKNGAIPTLHIEVGLADRVTITIYNVAGQQLLRETLTQSPALIDSGRGPQYAYEYSWTGHIASGVYLYLVEADKAGTRIKRRGKFAVIR